MLRQRRKSTNEPQRGARLLSLVMISPLPLLGGCGSTQPDLQQIYGRAAVADETTRNPVIVITGLLGTRLVDDA